MPWYWSGTCPHCSRIHLDKPEQTSTAAESLIARLPRLSMITGLFALAWLIVVALMIVRPGSTTGA
jgi:hypothetical protein